VHLGVMYTPLQYHKEFICQNPYNV
jgi:hypothetical protein